MEIISEAHGANGRMVARFDLRSEHTTKQVIVTLLSKLLWNEIGNFGCGNPNYRVRGAVIN